MSYIERSLLPNEHIVRRGRLPQSDWLGLVLPAVVALWFPVLWLIVALIFLGTFIRRRTIEIAITNQRLIYQHGWIARKTEEVDLRRIAEINLEQGPMGRIFGFGKVLCRGVGSGGINLPPIDNPMDFRRALQEAQVKLDASAQ
ncbi:MAG: PH domain-containing protein [Truepera sp.]|nr:PH domain-containing protein [Truepera sp.]